MWSYFELSTSSLHLIVKPLTEDAVGEALTAIEMIRGELVEETVEAILRAAFREMRYEKDGERRVRGGCTR